MSSEGSLKYPTEYRETYTVRKPMGVRIHKSDGRITHIEVNSVLTGKAFVGDIIVEIDSVPITKIEELYRKLKEPNEKVTVKIRHGTWSWCQHKATTVERIQMDKDSEKVTGRAINIYYIVIRISCAPELRNLQLGVNVKYDARERLQVNSVDPFTIAAVHLRPGDIIREVNDRAVASKTMLCYYITEGILKDGWIRFLIESPAGDSYRDTVEMAPDVIEIASKQIEMFKKNLSLLPLKSCYVSSKNKNPVSIALTERTEVEIAADCDPSKLRSCKNSK